MDSEHDSRHGSAVKRLSQRRAWVVSTAILFALCFSRSFALAYNETLENPCATDDAQPNWRTFVSHTHRFCFQYPPQYRSQKPPQKLHLPKEYKLLAYFTNGEPRDLGAKGEWPDASITVLFCKTPFTLEYVKKNAPTGLETPSKVQIGSHTFYGWGPGGGGVRYPDVYIYNLHGQPLSLLFDGPYTGGSKSPIRETQGIERKLLASFRTF
jgi:hypothetical protein